MNKAHENINWENYPSDSTALDAYNLNKMDNSIDTIDDRVVALDSSKATKTEVATLVTDVKFEESTGIITVIKKNGSKFTIDTQMEKIAVNFGYDPVTQKITLTLIDGTKQYIDLSALITQYEFLDSATIGFAARSDGKITATLKGNSITEEYLESNYLSDIKVEVAKTAKNAKTASDAVTSATSSKESASTSADNAKISETNAKASEDSAQSYAVGGTGTRDGEDTDNSKYYNQQASAFAKNAKTSETNAKASATSAGNSATVASSSAANAKTSETNAADSAKTVADKAAAATQSAANAKTSETNAADSQKMAQSYVVGGTGTRTNEDTDNAKYYSQQASAKATSASSSAANAKTSETNAASSANTASSKAAAASTSANTASSKATAASNSATSASASAKQAAASESNAASSATLAYNYAMGDTDSAKYYAKQAKDASESLKGGLKPMGTVTFANLPTLSSAASGDMYNISTSFTTTSSFKEGAGNIIVEGANVYKTADGYWDILAGTPVAGVKGAKETTYRRGNVNITAANVGAVATDGDASNTTVKFTEATSRTKPTTGDKLLTIIGKVTKFLTDLKTVAFSGSYNDLTNKPTSLPANGGNSTTVNGHKVEKDVPSNAVFTDTHVPVVDELTSTATASALSANQGRILKEGQDAINQSLGRLSDVVISRHHSDSNKYYDFYYDKGAGYLGCIYNLGSNGINGIRPTLFTLRTSYDGTQIQFNQLTDAPNPTINITKAANNKYVTLSITDSVQKTNLSYLNVWMCKVS